MLHAKVSFISCSRHFMLSKLCLMYGCLHIKLRRSHDCFFPKLSFRLVLFVFVTQLRHHAMLIRGRPWRYSTALDISTGPLARRTFQTAGPVRASTFHLSLARTGHLDICRATRFQIVLARTMTIHSMYFSRGRPSHISAVFAQPFCYSETPACRESESGMSIKHTDVSV